MNNDLQEQIDDLKDELSSKEKFFQSEVDSLKSVIEELRNEISSNPATSSVNSDAKGSFGVRDREFLFSGNSKFFGVTVGEGSSSQIDVLQMAVGKDPATISDSSSRDMEVFFQHQYANNVSFIGGRRNPIYSNLNDNASSISVSSGGTTLTQAKFAWTTDELANAYVNIYDSSKNYVCTRKISSNTSTTLTISTTFPSSQSNCFYLVWMGVYVGISQFPFMRCSVMEGTEGGVRFGLDATASGQNGLLYMDATGDLYWRNKGGTATKLN